MSHSIWRTRATRSAGAPEEELTLLRKDSVEIDLWMDDLASFSLTLHKTTSKRKRDDRTVIQDELTLSCKACTELLYRSTLGVVRLEDLSEARTIGQFHLSECLPKAKTETAEEGTEEGSPANHVDQEIAATPELPRRTYCD